jgi:hypothetical protein
MRLLIQLAVVLFGTLMTAGLVALAGPGSVELIAPQTREKSQAPLLAFTGGAQRSDR